MAFETLVSDSIPSYKHGPLLPLVLPLPNIARSAPASSSRFPDYLYTHADRTEVRETKMAREEIVKRILSVVLEL